MPERRTHPVRYRIESWGKPVPSSNKGRKVRPGIRVSDDNFGYADDLFLASIMRNKKGDVSVLLLSSDGGPKPSKEMLMLVRDQINHHLAEHCQ